MRVESMRIEHIAATHMHVYANKLIVCVCVCVCVCVRSPSILDVHQCILNHWFNVDVHQFTSLYINLHHSTSIYITLHQCAMHQCCAWFNAMHRHVNILIVAAWSNVQASGGYDECITYSLFHRVATMSILDTRCFIEMKQRVSTILVMAIK